MPFGDDLQETQMAECRRGNAAGWSLVIPGATLLGMGIGLLVGNPGFGLFMGLGAGMVYWGTLITFRKKS